VKRSRILVESSRISDILRLHLIICSVRPMWMVSTVHEETIVL